MSATPPRIVFQSWQMFAGNYQFRGTAEMTWAPVLYWLEESEIEYVPVTPLGPVHDFVLSLDGVSEISSGT